MASYIPDEYLMLDNTGPCGHGKSINLMLQTMIQFYFSIFLIKFSIWKEMGSKEGPSVEDCDDEGSGNFDVKGNVQIDDSKDFVDVIDFWGAPTIHENGQLEG